MTRQEIQIEGLKAWKPTKRGTLVLPTGTGKTWCGIHAVKLQVEKNLISTALVVVPTVNLIDQWREEFKKWGYPPEYVDFVCVNSAYKYEKEVDLLIVDEIHTALSPVFRALFTNIKYKQILGLTATVPEKKEYRKVLEEFAPIVYTKTLTEISSTGNIIADFEVYNLEIPMTRHERSKYNIFDGMFNEARGIISSLKKNIEGLENKNAFDIASEYNKKTTFTSRIEEDLIKASKQFWSAMTMRKFACYNSSKKLDVALQIVKMFPDRRWILFNKTIKQAEKLHAILGGESVIYHSKLKDDERKLVLEQFASNKEIKYLIAADALNAGLNVEDIDAAISLSGVSTELPFIQRIGRTLRLMPNKKALFINLYSKDTVEKRWVANKTQNIKVIWIKAINQLNNAN